MTESFHRLSNKQKAWKTTMSILEVLFDGKWHRVEDLKVETHVSPRSLYKNLKRLEGFLIEKKKDKTAYPNPTYYRATPTLLSIIAESFLIEKTTKAIMEDLSNNKDIQSTLKFASEITNAKIKSILSAIKKDKIKNTEVILFFLRWYFFPFQEILTTGIVKASLPIIDDLDL
jgi:DNA-binding HxlR family transcriptional regulator